MSAEQQKTLVLENTARRDLLVATEQKYQEIWAKEKVFQVDPPKDAEIVTGEELAKKYPSFLGTMAYPYMNGVLHAGHCFTLSKVEFATGFERMNGKVALFPLGFHCTGIAISAAADKIAREMELFGPNFENAPKDEDEDEEAAPAQEKGDPSKFGSKKTKTLQKTGSAKYQFQIMLQVGVPREEIKKFADHYYWVHYFPPKVIADCNIFGARIDWRRSFVTTDACPYYDSFVRWTMNSLKAKGKIRFGKRYTIYSAKDGQPCMDHDRSSGESLGPQEYTGIKIKVLEWTDKAKETLDSAKINLEGKSVYLVAATLRPETMYGQTCCYVSPKINYGVFDAGNNEYFICTERAFKNMCFQDLTPKRGDWSSLTTINGSELIGSKIHAPLSIYPELRVLPMETILANKGTGVVTSVPSDSPDDYITQLDLRNKCEYYKIDKDWVKYDPVPIIKTPNYGDMTAQKLVEEFKIKSPKDKDALAKAKEIAYKEGFYEGVMIIGEYKGLKVEEAKPKVRQALIDNKEAFAYSEPEGMVISRSGDECVVSLQDQWYTDYGEPSWKALAEECLAQMNVFNQETRNAFEKVLDWLKNWALSRSYGLGTKIPWDPQYLVESLSDSTVYMAFYTVSHFLLGDPYGKTRGSLDIGADEMTDAVWDYIFHVRDDVPESTIAENKLRTMRESFAYFYPMDLRVSGKDLIPNHLSFCIYVHTALFPKRFWPKGIRANGFLLLNNEKMSKSTGNFMTLREVVTKFGADAARVALADAGDTFEDANFEESNANAAILRLFNLREWMETILKNPEELRSGPIDNFFDKAFLNEMDQLAENTYSEYSTYVFKAALKSGLFDLQIARDFYRDAVQSVGLKMHIDVVKKYIELQSLVIAPITPHFSEYVWRELLGNKTSVHDAKFPRATKAADKSVLDALEYVRQVGRSIREVEGTLMKKKKKKISEFDTKKPSKITIYSAKTFPEWQEQYIELVRDAFEHQSLDFNREFQTKVAKLGDVKNGMKFVHFLKNRLTVGGEDPSSVFDRKLAFDEAAVLKDTVNYLKKAANGINVQEIQLVQFDHKNSNKGFDLFTNEEVELPAGKVIQEATPGNPGITIDNL